MTWDVLVIGAGPAGSVAARELAGRGCRVLLVDKANFPRAKVCGCCLNGAAVATLERLGLGDVLAGAIPIDRVNVAAGLRSAELRLPSGVALSREVFDSRLLAEAVRAGAEFRPGTMVTPFSRDAKGSVVIVASGLIGGTAAPEPGSRIGAGVILAAEVAPTFFGPGTIHMATGRGGYVGLVRVEDGRLDVAAAFDTTFVKTAGGLGPAAEAILREVGWPIPAGLAEQPWKGTSALTRRPRKLGGHRTFVVGDAAGYVEPFTGEGMAWALMSAAALAPIAARAVREWDDRLVSEWEATHRRVVGNRQRVCRVVSRAVAFASPYPLRRSRARRIPDSVSPHGRCVEPSFTIGPHRMSFTILGLGTAHPPDPVTPADGLRVARFLAGPDVRTSTWLGPVYANSGNTRRYQIIGGSAMRDLFSGTNESGSPFLPSASNDGVGPTTGERMRVYAEEASPIALRAAALALAESGYTADSITHLITVSCTGFAAPGVDLALIEGVGLPRTVQRTHVGFMGCHGALNGLRVANAFATADPAARVLVCAVELCSLHYYYGSTADKLVANAIFADGAAAVVGQGLAAAPPGRALNLVASGSCLIPNSTADMRWTVSDHGFEMTLSRKVPGLIATHLRPWLESWLNDNGLSLLDVRSWAVHPGGPKIVTAVEEGLELQPDALAASRGVFAEYGNMSSPTVLFVLDRLRKQNAPRPCVALGFGPGLVAEAALFM